MWTHVRTHPEVVVGEPTEPDFEGALAQLTQSFVTGGIPLQYIENKELVAAFQLVAPGFVLPSRKTLRNRDSSIAGCCPCSHVCKDGDDSSICIDRGLLDKHDYTAAYWCDSTWNHSRMDP